MSSWADKIIAEAMKYKNMTERSKKDNYGYAEGSAAYNFSSQGAKIVNDSNVEGGYGVSNTPWCANWILTVAKRVGYKPYMHTRYGNPSILHGYTGYVWDNAKGKGWLKGTTSPAPGAIGIKNGKHVFLCLTGADKNGRYESLGANESDMIRHATRSTSEGWSFIIPGGEWALGSYSGGTTTVYLFERLDWKPTLFGSWKSADARDGQYAKREAYNAAENTGRLLRKIRYKGGYAFEEWPPGSWVNGGWRNFTFGSWPTKEQRDSQRDKYQAANPEASLRIYSEKRSAASNSAPSASGDVKYT